MADVGTLLPGRKVVDYVSALIAFTDGTRGTFTVTQAAAGGENDIRLRVYGEKGMLEWWHRDPSYLRVAMQGEPARVVTRGDPFLPPAIIALGRSPRGHPEGLREAFANIYGEMAQDRMMRDLGDAPAALPYPRIEEGAHTMAFIEACIRSSASGRWEDVAKLLAVRATGRPERELRPLGGQRAVPSGERGGRQSAAAPCATPSVMGRATVDFAHASSTPATMR